jgi:hypothetical protein
MTVQEKSITAGISPARVKKEMERFSISRIGLAFLRAPLGLPAISPTRGEIRPQAMFDGFVRQDRGGQRHPRLSILQRLFAQRVGEQVEPEHEGHQRDDRRQGRVDVGAQRRLESLIAVPQSGLSGASPRPK